MNVVSWPFLVLLGTFVAIYWCMPRERRLAIAAVAGFAMLAWIAPMSSLICLGLALATYLSAPRIRSRAWAYAIGAMILLALIAGRELGADWSKVSGLVPWVGAAFYTLRAIHYLISVVEGGPRAASLAEYLRYTFFPPTLLVGPIQHFDDFEREARRNRFDVERFSLGLERLLFGYAKIVLFGSWLAIKFGHWVATLEPGAWHRYCTALQYGFELYFKFAGYSDLAIGAALLLGMRVPENFRFPFLAVNISDFWRRWNMSVSGWCREHVNLPLYARTRSPAVAALGAMLVLGLWHECSTRYLLWGAYHGVGILVWQQWHRATRHLAWPKGGYWHRIGDGLGGLLTFNFVVGGFAITQASDGVEAISALRELFGL